ncbi:hypothetical protein [Sphingomonas sp. 37zxx]|uniref:hypothetical protein n=1 Tax=Sphingomonas sp. 37zxx TaxID=1550073 RepID=UPI00053BDAA4|nr:hypothetical protein [Sphingomonas sp. 37zxx]
MNRLAIGMAATMLLTGCAARPAQDAQGTFFGRLQALCGKAFAGRVTTDDPADAGFADKPLVMQVRDCSGDTIRIPFHVGDDRSRTWVISRTPGGLRLKHDHRHADGSEDSVTQYGGDTAGPGTATFQSFPVDATSIALFTATGRTASTTNVWEVEASDTIFAYGLRRADRHFRVAFDLTRPVAAPPPPWGQ